MKKYNGTIPGMFAGFGKTLIRRYSWFKVSGHHIPHDQSMGLGDDYLLLSPDSSIRCPEQFGIHPQASLEGVLAFFKILQIPLDTAMVTIEMIMRVVADLVALLFHFQSQIRIFHYIVPHHKKGRFHLPFTQLVKYIVGDKR